MSLPEARLTHITFIARVKQILPRSRFARNVSVLAGGTAAGQIIVIAASPILTRLYSPEDFGLLAVFSALIGMLGVIASLRYQLAIPLPEDDKDARSLVELSSFVVLAMTLILMLVVILLGDMIAKRLNAPLLADYMWLLPVGLFLTGIYQVFSYLAIRQSAVGALAKTKVSQATVMTAVQLAGFALGPLALLLGRIFGQSAGIFTLSRATRSKYDSQSAPEESLRQRLTKVGSRYRSFPLVSTWTGLASAGASNLPPLLIASFFGPMAAGLFALTHRVLSQPMAVLGKAVGDVFYREAAQAHRKNVLKQIVDNVYVKLVTLAMPITTTIFLVAPESFILIFGEQWKQAGELARWVSVWLFFQFIALPPTRVYPILERHGAALRFQFGLLISGILSIAIGAMVFDSFIIGIAIMSISNGLVYVVRLMLTYSLVGMHPLRPIKLLGKSVPYSFLCNLPLFALWIYQGDLNVFNPMGLVILFANIILVGLFVYMIARSDSNKII